jgi:hypothetical protein
LSSAATGRRPRQRRVRPHPAGVGAGVVVADALEVLRGQQRHHGLAVDEAEERHLGPVEVGLQQYRVPTVQERARVGAGDVEVGAHHHALARGQAVVLHDVRRGEAGERGVQVRRVVHHDGGRRADPGSGHDLLGEALRALDPGGGRARAEAGDAGRAHRIGRAGHERRLRADHDEICPPVDGERGHRGGIRRVDAAVLGHRGRTGVSRRAGQRRDAGVLREGENDGVLPSTGPNDQNAHVTGS